MSDVASSRPNAKEVMLTFFPVNVEVVPYFSAHVILRSQDSLAVHTGGVQNVRKDIKFPLS